MQIAPISIVYRTVHSLYDCGNIIYTQEQFKNVHS